MSDKAQGTIRGEVPARVLDVSERGARLALETPFEVGSTHDLSLELDGQHLSIQAEVRHVGPADESGTREMGVEFIGIAPGDVQRLRAFIERSRGR
jgi:c-di-GMP-binding flagellar brake protein YcgR